jgi:Threonine dehydratase
LLFIALTAEHAMCGKALLSEGRSWHGPYPNYDEAFGKAKEMSPRKGVKFCHPQYSPRQWDGEGTKARN